VLDSCLVHICTSRRERVNYYVYSIDIGVFIINYLFAEDICYVRARILFTLFRSTLFTSLDMIL